MLAADKDALLAEMKRGYLALREKEIFFINNNFTALGRQAALIAGFVVITLTNLVLPSNTPATLKGFFFLALCASLSYGLVAVSNSMLINVYGVGKALRGGDSESILKTLEGMREAMRHSPLPCRSSRPPSPRPRRGNLSILPSGWRWPRLS